MLEEGGSSARSSQRKEMVCRLPSIPVRPYSGLPTKHPRHDCHAFKQKASVQMASRQAFAACQPPRPRPTRPLTEFKRKQNKNSHLCRPATVAIAALLGVAIFGKTNTPSTLASSPSRRRQKAKVCLAVWPLALRTSERCNLTLPVNPSLSLSEVLVQGDVSRGRTGTQ
ncbi:hypothetical protein LY76DRAFT_113729 [Colletotrichum caudatum]|nr:hypothetical protein LY76DRAFT_113729 [Colletotrichum caudatum]